MSTPSRQQFSPVAPVSVATWAEDYARRFEYAREQGRIEGAAWLAEIRSFKRADGSAESDFAIGPSPIPPPSSELKIEICGAGYKPKSQDARPTWIYHDEL